MIKLFKETISELKRTSFPNRKELIENTSIVIGVCVTFTTFVFLCDTILNLLLKMLLK